MTEGVSAHAAVSPDADASGDTGAMEALSSVRDRLFDDIVKLHSPLIARIALSHEADPGLRRDLMQDILLAIWIALPSFRGESSVKTFIASIARKRCLSHAGRRAREPRAEVLPEHLVSSALLPDEAAEAKDQKRRLARSIRRLPIQQREAIVLAFEGFSFVEVGEVLGISANAAMLRCQRAKASLREMMGPQVMPPAGEPGAKRAKRPKRTEVPKI